MLFLNMGFPTGLWKQANEIAGNLSSSDVVCHSTKVVATSWAALRGLPLSEICAAASWTASCTFSCFYQLNVASGSILALATPPLIFHRLTGRWVLVPCDSTV